MVNATIMDNNNGGKDGKDGKDGSKDDANDGDNNDDEDDENDWEDDNDVDKGVECDDRNGEHDGMIVSADLDERVYSVIDTLKRKCEKSNIECGVLCLVVPKQVTNKEPTELSFLCCHKNYGRFLLENFTMLNNCCHRWWTTDSSASYSCLVFLRCCVFKAENIR